MDCLSYCEILNVKMCAKLYTTLKKNRTITLQVNLLKPLYVKLSGQLKFIPVQNSRSQTIPLQSLLLSLAVPEKGLCIHVQSNKTIICTIMVIKVLDGYL